jgi:putative Mg2+ transporter-C (MgtC) family protein
MTISSTDILLRILTAVVLGGLIGFERGRTDHPAGLRTHILVALASATFMLVSTQIIFLQNYESSPLVQNYTRSELILADITRIASGVVMGMGFLGAGSILRTGLNVHGLTTAACLWLVSAIGLAAGCGMYLTSAASTLGGLAVLVGLGYLENQLRTRVKRIVTVDFTTGSEAREELLALAKELHADLARFDFAHNLKSDHSRILAELDFKTPQEADELYSRLEKLSGVIRIKIHTPRM